MVEILRNKNLATKFQILAEIANSGPHIQQRDIAKRLELTPQAISDYIGQMVKDDLISLDGHSGYRITNSGVNWIIKVLKEIKDYSNFIAEAITSISVCAAIADSKLTKGQEVGLEMKDGLLMAIGKAGAGARGIAFSDAASGEDVGVANIEGIVELEAGRVTVLMLPGIQKGGSRTADLEKLKEHLKGRPLIGVIGIEALVALRRINAKGISNILTKNIKLPKDDADKKVNKLAMDGIKLVKTDKAHVEAILSQIQRILSHYNEQGEQQRKQTYEALKADFQMKVEQALRQQGGNMAGMRIDIEKQPQFQEEWRKLKTQMDSQYVQVLSESLQELNALE